ncbi:MAG: hypothetical protein WAW39_30605 [Prosthecobacter sp.]|uniref:hypothetical protein n=1 Tax=Prosthecobacter sp. TaxID=1965333 RepID=UPI003BAF6EF0
MREAFPIRLPQPDPLGNQVQLGGEPDVVVEQAMESFRVAGEFADGDEFMD